jgi:hypothetical protein
VKFLDGSFSDTNGIANVESTETFTIATPTATVNNFANGVTYDQSALNDLTKGQTAGIYASDATSPYIEVTFAPVAGATLGLTPPATPTITGGPTVGTATLIAKGTAFNQLATSTTITNELNSPTMPTETSFTGLFGGVDPLGATPTVQVITASKLWRLSDGTHAYFVQVEGANYQLYVDDGSRTFRFALSGSFNAGPISVSLAAGAWQDSANNASAPVSIGFTARAPAATFFIDLSGGMTLNSAGLLSEPIFDIRGEVLFQVQQSPGPRFQLDFNGTFKVVYLGNLASVAGRFVLDTVNHDAPNADSDALTAGQFLRDLGNSGAEQLGCDCFAEALGRYQAGDESGCAQEYRH